MDKQNEVYPYGGILFSLKKERNPVTFYTTWMNSQDTMLGEIISHSQTDEYYVIHLRDVYNSQIHSKRRQNSVWWKDYRVSLLQGEKVLEVCCITMKIPFMLLSYTLRNGKEDTVGWGHWGRISPETLQFSWILKVRMSLSGVGNGFLGKGSKTKGWGGKNHENVSGTEPSSVFWL